MHEPYSGHINFSNRRSLSRCGGMLDVDANGADGPVKDPVENIFYARQATMLEGLYTLNVNNYTRRSSGAGFEVEIDIMGNVYSMSYDKALRQSESVKVAILKYSRAKGVEIVESPADF